MRQYGRLWIDLRLAAPMIEKEVIISDVAILPPASVLPVSELNALVRSRLESSFPLCWVGGEVSNLTYASSGHVYFSLRDSHAQARCVMFRNRSQLLGWRLENGQHVVARVLVTLYEARGDFQLNVDAVRKAGLGRLYEEFLLIKSKLEQEGLFASEIKRPLPGFPRCIGLITSPQAAALRDVMTTLKRRAPHVRIILYPTMVQGEHASVQIASAIVRANERKECDVLILCRGGGSLEDLRPFNDEYLARTLRASLMPVITGIGHETDFTLADFVADKRAPTPTAAAEIAAPERSMLMAKLATHQNNLHRQLVRHIENFHQKLDGLDARLLHPHCQLQQRFDRLLNLQRRLNSAGVKTLTHNARALDHLKQRFLRTCPDVSKKLHKLLQFLARLKSSNQLLIQENSRKLESLATSLSSLNPERVLARGYSVVTDESGNIVHNNLALHPNEQIAVFFHRGSLCATVTSINKKYLIE